MGILSELSPQTFESLADEVSATAGSSGSQEEAAQAFAAAVSRALGGNAVLSRVYATVPYGELPDENRDFVAALAAEKGVGDELRDGTAVLSLLGTYGEKPEWRDRHQSQGHKGIPLTSSSFVTAIPMIASLLQQMGIGIHWLDEEDLHAHVAANRVTGSFYVEDAANEEDSQGRKVIPAQEFVEEHGVHGVFGIGDAYVNGGIAVLIVFCSGTVKEESLEKLRPAVDAYVGATSGKQVFAG